VEALVSSGGSWRGRRVLLTGHTGFIGSWLALWLHRLGAEVTGFALPPPTKPSLFEQARIAELVTHVEEDIRHLDAVRAAMVAAQPEIVFHLAAQPLVRLSYDQPVETFATNLMGTVHLLEAARQSGSVKAFVCITTDKCYQNREWWWPYRETDQLGGHDPYSASKATAELAVASYRASFCSEEGTMAIASVRAGNVIGGGDWAEDRLIPDLVRAFEAGIAPVVRSPASVRPWQHVLEALGGYLLIAERLLAGERRFADAWNFGPGEEDARPVGWIVDHIRRKWGGLTADPMPAPTRGPHEAGLLRLDCSKARAELGWRPRLSLDEALDWIVRWHQTVGHGGDAREQTLVQIDDYLARCSPLRL
jgi:CDP-glucose 4,6-dehydratase